MNLNGTYFDAIITDSIGQKLEVECQILEPRGSGLPAEILIEIPLKNTSSAALENPCTLHGIAEIDEIEIKDLWYRSMSTGDSQRKHERGKFDINYAGQLSIRSSFWKNEQTKIRFNLSPIRFFQDHLNATMVNYSNTPSKEVELFKLKTAELGDIRFIKYWSIYHVDKKGLAAEIHASFGAEINFNEAVALPVEQLSQKLRDVLIPLSILTRQAITLHGWECRKREGIETVWLDPLQPNLAPDMAVDPIQNLYFADEFEVHAQSLVDRFLAAAADLKEVITLISVALAPHIERQTSGNFLALFSALEKAIALESLTAEEKTKLKESDGTLVSELIDLKLRIEREKGPHAEMVAARVAGLVEMVKNSAPSFQIKFNKLLKSYPALQRYMSDLWPMFGTRKAPGLKQIRDSLAHGLRQEYNTQAIGVGHWHFERLSERLAFILLGLEIPKGIQLNSFPLVRDPWYERTYWESLREGAKRNLG